MSDIQFSADETERLLGKAKSILAEDDDHMVATSPGDVAWLAAQLVCWPLRVDERCTTNERFLRQSAAATILRAETPQPIPSKSGEREAIALTSLQERNRKLEEAALPWRSIDEAPKDGTLIAALVTIRWRPYKPNSEQYRRGIKGRWQEANGYGGWVNCVEPPERFLPHPGALLPGGGEG